MLFSDSIMVIYFIQIASTHIRTMPTTSAICVATVEQVRDGSKGRVDFDVAKGRTRATHGTKVLWRHKTVIFTLGFGTVFRKNWLGGIEGSLDPKHQDRRWRRLTEPDRKSRRLAREVANPENFRLL